MKAPLEGIRVIDLSQVIAGPYGGALLAQNGADVIKVEPLTGEMSRASIASTFYGLNYGKRGICLNLRTREGQGVLRRLVESADVLIENFRPGVMKRLQASYEQMHEINPRLIYVSISAFGEDGPYAHRPGFDPLLQAMTGIERAQGGEHNPPVFLRIAVTDYATALMQAGAICFALYRREHTGRGQRLEFSLLRSGVWVNAEAFTRYEGRPPRPLPDAGQNGFGPLDRMYQTADGWLFLLVEDDPERWQRLTKLDAFAYLADDARFASAEDRRENAEALAAELEKIFTRKDAEAWLSLLEDAGVPAAPVVTRYERRFFEDVQPIANRYSISGTHSESGRVETPGRFIKYSGLEEWNGDGRSSPTLGEHTTEVLTEIGYKRSEIAAMRATGIVV